MGSYLIEKNLFVRLPEYLQVRIARRKVQVKTDTEMSRKIAIVVNLKRLFEGDASMKIFLGAKAVATQKFKRQSPA